jgi:hypothetical protein
MAKERTEDDAISLGTIGVDFDITQTIDGNWDVHAVIKNHRRRRDLIHNTDAVGSGRRLAASRCRFGVTATLGLNPE